MKHITYEKGRQAVINLEDLSVTNYGNLILQNISFEIKRGEFVFLIGKTGCGKSTLLKTLYADVPLSSGRANVAGFDLTNIDRREIPFLRRNLGIIFQDFQLLSDRSINENLKFVLEATGWRCKHEIKLKIEEVLNKVGLNWVGDKFPHQLSGGEQQRTAVARALLNDPAILLADEPTGNLDPEVADDIINIFLKINKSGTAVLMATHNHGFLEKYPFRVLACHNGCIAESESYSHKV